METLSDIIIHLRDKVAPMTSGELRYLVDDAIYALKAINYKQRPNKAINPTPDTGPLEQSSKSE